MLIKIVQPVLFSTTYFQNDVLDILGNYKDAQVMCLTKKSVDYLYKSEEVEDKLG